MMQGCTHTNKTDNKRLQSHRENKKYMMIDCMKETDICRLRAHTHTHTHTHTNIKKPIESFNSLNRWLWRRIAL